MACISAVLLIARSSLSFGSLAVNVAVSTSMPKTESFVPTDLLSHSVGAKDVRQPNVYFDFASHLLWSSFQFGKDCDEVIKVVAQTAM